MELGTSQKTYTGSPSEMEEEQIYCNAQVVLPTQKRTRQNTYTISPSEREDDQIYCNAQVVQPSQENADQPNKKCFFISFIVLVFFCLVQFACIGILFHQVFELTHEKTELIDMIQKQNRTLGERIKKEEMISDLISGQAAMKRVSSFLAKSQEAFENISSIIPSFYSYKYDALCAIQYYINDGGRDMYDFGNEVRIYDGSDITVNPVEYGSKKIDWNYSYAITPPGSHPFMSLVWISNQMKNEQQYRIQVTGNLGADGSGIISLVDDGYLNISSDKIHFRVFQVYDASDPSVCEVYFAILKEEWSSSGFQSMSLSHKLSTENINNTATISGQPHNILFGYTLLSRKNGSQVSRDSIELFLRKLGDFV